MGHRDGRPLAGALEVHGPGNHPQAQAGLGPGLRLGVARARGDEEARQEAEPGEGL